MDITSVTSFRRATTRADLRLDAGEVFIAGGTWMMSDPDIVATGFVDLTTMGWPDLEITDEGLRIGATCSIARLVAFAEVGGQDSGATPRPADWHATSLFVPAANALLASFKIWNTATVGGNIGRAFSAGAMVSLAAGLDGIAVVWTPDGGERRIAVAELMTGNGSHSLARGEVLRAVEVPAHALRSRAALRKIALAEHGRSGAVVTGRVDPDGASVFAVSAATETPHVMRFEMLPDAAALADAVGAASGYFTDPQGAADWRRGVSVELAEDIRRELEASA